MSGTRHATDGAFHPCRFASSPEFTRGLPFNLVAKAAALLDARTEERELVWLLQYLSFQDGGLSAFAGELIARYADRFGTSEMQEIGKLPRQNYTAADIHKIRRSNFPPALRHDLRLGEDRVKVLQDDIATAQDQLHNFRGILLSGEPISDRDYYEDKVERLPYEIDRFKKELEAAEQMATEQPLVYSVEAVQQLCIAAGKQETADSEPLDKVLSRICLDPSWDWTAGAPWYFVRLVETLREFKKQWESDPAGLVETPVVTMIRETLDYCAAAGGLTLLTGPSNVGAQFAASELCRRQPWRYRCFDVPPTNDGASFFHGIGQALGGNFTSYTNVQIEERIRAVLRSGELTLVLTSAEYLWPQKNLREAFPSRLTWLMSQTQNGAKVCLIAGPQFFMQKRPCEKSGWNSPEFANRFAHVGELPADLSVEDLAAIAKKVLPSARSSDCEKMAINAVASDRYLVSIGAVAKRAQYVAGRGGRAEPNGEDVEAALAFVAQSDKFLAAQLAQNNEAGARRKPGRKPGASAQPPQQSYQPTSTPAAEISARSVLPAIESPLPALARRGGVTPAPLPRTINA